MNTKVLAVLALASLAACTEVHQTDRCIGTRYGKVVEEKMDVGLNLTMFETANCFTMTDQNYPQTEDGKETMKAQTKDPMTVEGDISLVYAFDPASVYGVFLEKRSADAAETQVMNAVRDGYRAALAGWSVTDLFSARRASLGDSIRAHIQAKLMTSKGPLAQMDFYVARIGDVPGRCADCAFRTGSDANRSQLVLHLVDNCLVHHGTFCCHHGEPDRPCVGYLALKQSFPEVSVPAPEAQTNGQ